MLNDPFVKFRLDDRVLILTGGAGFLGQQYIQIFADAGAHVVVWDKNPKDEFLRSSLVKEKTAAVMTVDITDEAQVQEAVAAIIKNFGNIDVLINNAAMNPAVGTDESKQQCVAYEDYPIELWEKEFKVNVTGSMICIKAVATHMMMNHKGVVVNIASGVAVDAYDNRVYRRVGWHDRYKSIAYTASKTAVLGLTRQWAERLGPYGIRVNSFSPGGVQTPQQSLEFVESYSGGTLLRRMAQIGEYGPILLFLCSDASSYMTGHNLVADGGKSAI